MRKIFIFMVVSLFFFNTSFVNNTHIFIGSQKISSTNKALPSIEFKTNSLSSFTFGNFTTINTQQIGWNELGPEAISNSYQASAPYSGRITAVAVNKTDSSIIYIGSAQGGVWKTIDGGQHWIPLTDNQLNLAIGSITISPDSKTIYVGTGEPHHSFDSYYGSGLLKSTDEGNTWQLLGQKVFNNSAVSSILVDSGNPNRILASSTFAVCCHFQKSVNNSNGIGIFQSQDEGSSWSSTNLVHQPNSSYWGISQLIASPISPSTIYASGYKGSVFKSIDNGQNWSKINFNTSDPDPQRVAIALSANKPDILYGAFTNSSSNLAGLYTYNTTDQVQTQLGSLPVDPQHSNYPCNSQCWYNLFMAVDPTNASIVYVGASDLYRSLDSGITWSIVGGNNASSQLPVIQQTFDFYPGNPSEIYVGTDKGFYSSANSGSTWINHNTDLRITQFISIAPSPLNDATILGGAHITGCGLYYGNSTTWKQVRFSNGGASLIFDNQNFFCNYVKLNVYKSTNGGLNWAVSSTGINTSDNSLFYPPMVQDPNNPSTLYIGGAQLYESTTSGSLWTANQNYKETNVITSIAIAKANSNVLYVGNHDGTIQTSNNGGSTWRTILNTTQEFGKTIPITNIAVDPHDSSHIFVALSTQNNPRLLETTNQGGTWATITNLGEISNHEAINVLLFNPISDILFLGTDRGAYYHNGTSFYRLGTELPHVAISDMKFSLSNYLIVATYGRGVWMNYITPEITATPYNKAVYSPNTPISVSTRDSNGINKTLYNWDFGNNITFVSTTNLTIPNSDGVHNLTVYAQDIAGNWNKEKFTFITQSPTTPSVPSPPNQVITSINISSSSPGAANPGFQIVITLPIILMISFTKLSNRRKKG